MGVTDAEINALAQALYTAHKQWGAERSERNVAWPRWFALRDDLKQPYLDAARAVEAGYPAIHLAA